MNASADYLEQQLLILLDNAFKYTPEGGDVVLSADIAEQSVKIAVTDTRPGIDDDDLSRISDRSYRGQNVNGTTGTGLGLAIAPWIADQHHGSIQIESHPGRGARFTIVVPRIEDREAAVDQAPFGELSSAYAASRSGRPRHRDDRHVGRPEH